MDMDSMHDQIRAVSDEFRSNRSERQRRRHLEKSDFDRLHEAGFTAVGVPTSQNGLWESVTKSTRPICEAVRTLGQGDSSVALVSAMHPAVLSYWLTAPNQVATSATWQQQCQAIYTGVKDGCWWGTITSEPGSGGDITKSKTLATQVSEKGEYKLTGQKHFGSGSGVMDFMVTTAIPNDADGPEWFFVDMRDQPWDGSTGLQLVGEWDGHGMIATQSHSFAFEGFPASRMAWHDSLLSISANAGAFIGCLFTSVIMGILDEAADAAEDKLRGQELGAFERSEWTRIRMEHWLAKQAFEGMLCSVETGNDVRTEILLGKTAIAELSETILNRICHVIGGRTLGRQSPFGFWLNDVRALGQLRPPWPLAFKNLESSSF